MLEDLLSSKLKKYLKLSLNNSNNNKKFNIFSLNWSPKDLEDLKEFFGIPNYIKSSLLEDLDLSKFTPRKRLILSGAKRSGKTIKSVALFIHYLLKTENKDAELGLIIGKSAQTIKTNVYPNIRLIANMHEPKLEVSINTQSNIILIEGYKVILRSGSEAGDEEIIRGMTASCLYINEATTITSEALKEALARVSANPKFIIMDTNPDSPLHFLKKEYIDKSESKNFLVKHYTLYDNIHIDREYIDSQIANYGLDSNDYKRDVLGKWIASEDAWFPNPYIVSNYNFSYPRMFIDPAFGGEDRTAITIGEIVNGIFTTYGISLKNSFFDTQTISVIKDMIDEYNVIAVFIEENTSSIKNKKDIILTEEWLSRYGIEEGYMNLQKVKAVKPKMKKEDKISLLIKPYKNKTWHIVNFNNLRERDEKDEREMEYITDILFYNGGIKRKIHDDPLDSISSLYAILNEMKSIFIF